jgi:hypothetical protein
MCCTGHGLSWSWDSWDGYGLGMVCAWFGLGKGSAGHGNLLCWAYHGTEMGWACPVLGMALKCSGLFMDWSSLCMVWSGYFGHGL